MTPVDLLEGEQRVEAFSLHVFRKAFTASLLKVLFYFFHLDTSYTTYIYVMQNPESKCYIRWDRLQQTSLKDEIIRKVIIGGLEAQMLVHHTIVSNSFPSNISL